MGTVPVDPHTHFPCMRAAGPLNSTCGKQLVTNVWLGRGATLRSARVPHICTPSPSLRTESASPHKYLWAVLIFLPLSQCHGVPWGSAKLIRVHPFASILSHPCGETAPRAQWVTTIISCSGLAGPPPSSGGFAAVCHLCFTGCFIVCLFVGRMRTRVCVVCCVLLHKG